MEQPDFTPSVVQGTAWQEFAECKGKTELFFGHPKERPQQRDRRERTARNICHNCIVIDFCRDYMQPDEYGVWAGTTEEERRKNNLSIPVRRRLSS